MKNTNKLFCLLILFCFPLLSSCAFDELALTDAEETALETEISAETSALTPADRFTVVFEENEGFPTEISRKASERIDAAILGAVKLLNTTEPELFPIMDCDYSARPQKRNTLKDPLSVEVYDIMLEKVSAFESYSFHEQDYPEVNFFNIFVSALDALRIDHTELFLYCDGRIDGTEYRSEYFMPGDLLGIPSENIEAIRAEVELCNAVVDRIIQKMPDGLSNYEKCCYFALVLALGNEYDYSETIPLYDYQAYSAFVKGKAICSGYAQAFYRLCREAGISCWYCRGTTPEGRHAWNMLDTENGPLYMDITWFDTEKIVEHYRDGKEQYLFMTQEDFDYYGYVQESCQ